MLILLAVLIQIACGINVENRLESLVNDVNQQYTDFEAMVGSTLIDNFQKERKAWSDNSLEVQGVLDTALELCDMVPQVHNELGRSVTIAKVIDKTIELVAPLDLLNAKEMRKDIKTEIKRIKKFRRGFRDLAKYMPSIEDMVNDMSMWTKHSIMLIEHIFTKVMNFKHFQKIWDGKLGTWFKQVGGKDHDLVNKVGSGAILTLTELLKMLNKRVKSIQFLHEWKKAFKAFEKSKSKVLYFFRKTKFLKLLKTKKIEALLPRKRCLKGRKTKDVRKLERWFKKLMKRGDRRRLRRQDWRDMDLAEFNDFQEQRIAEEEGQIWNWDDLDLPKEAVLGDGEGDSNVGWHWGDLQVPDLSETKTAEGYNRQLDHTNQEIKKTMRKMARKIKKKVKKQTRKKMNMCKEPVVQKMSIVKLMGDIGSLKRLGATKTLHGLFKPFLEMAGLTPGDRNAKLITRLQGIIPKGSKKVTERFTPKVLISVLHNIGFALGQSCSVMSMGAEKLGEMHNLVIGLDNQISAYKPSTEIKEIMKRTKDIFNPKHVAEMIRKFFGHCTPPKIDSPPQGNPKDPTKTKAAKGSSEQEQLEQPESIPTREKGTKAERGEVKSPRKV